MWSLLLLRDPTTPSATGAPRRDGGRRGNVMHAVCSGLDKLAASTTGKRYARGSTLVTLGSPLVSFDGPSVYLLKQTTSVSSHGSIMSTQYPGTPLHRLPAFDLSLTVSEVGRMAMGLSISVVPQRVTHATCMRSSEPPSHPLLSNALEHAGMPDGARASCLHVLQVGWRLNLLARACRARSPQGRSPPRGPSPC